MSSKDPIVVIGHRSPDLDSIASALAYAEFLKVQGFLAIAGRSGPVNKQTSWALKKFGLDAPSLILDVAPTFGKIAVPLSPASENLSLSEAICKLSDGERAIPIVDSRGIPVILVDARVCVALLGSAFSQKEPTQLSSLLATSLTKISLGSLEHSLLFRSHQRLSEEGRKIAAADPDDFLVVDNQGFYLGVVSRGQALSPPKTQIVMVDHNELGQSVNGIEEAEIIEVIDHHRLGNPGSLSPIPFWADIVGSTATLIAERFKASEIPLPAELAGLLLSALLSDTLAFRSPTTTDRDRKMALFLGDLAGISDFYDFGRSVVLAGVGLGDRSGSEIILADYKIYDSSVGILFVSQAEVSSLDEITQRTLELQGALNKTSIAKGAVLGLLLLTDPIRGQSQMIVFGEPKWIDKLPYPLGTDGVLFELGPVVSRKKQLVPAVLAALEN